jgi:hypothetical protein
MGRSDRWWPSAAGLVWHGNIVLFLKSMSHLHPLPLARSDYIGPHGHSTPWPAPAALQLELAPKPAHDVHAEQLVWHAVAGVGAPMPK